MEQTSTPSKSVDRRQFNNPHAAVHTAGAAAARKGLRVCSCPYHHPAMRASWLKGFAQAQQLTLDL
ncbi:CrpP family protein [Pseudomonas gingeri]|uniref:CrpP family protein n=1 Tax=Pseudomonas gingeri TaxID=117681 RepID=A0A7Y7X8D1_9PSED|nr:CrpP family ICE-associated protein [Pseudomonas gingeri]NWB94881.1 CrpP family protein [Pseudomonas gingeri]